MTRLLAKGEKPAWKRLIAPLRYLAIRHGIKPRFDWWWPLALATVTMFVFWILPVRPKVLGEAGFLKSVRDLIALLAAFFVAALAAVATFARPTLDQYMEGTTPSLDGKDLTRRQYVCFLFGYLSVLSFCLFLVIVTAEIVTPSLRLLLSARVMWWMQAVAGSVFALAFWNMIVTTFLGVYFLVDRVHLVPAKDSGVTGAPSTDQNAPPGQPKPRDRRAS